MVSHCCKVEPLAELRSYGLTGVLTEESSTSALEALGARAKDRCWSCAKYVLIARR